MSDRYTRLFSLPEELYAAGSPVAVAAGALQKDNQTGRVFIQLKFRSLQDREIKALSVRIAAFDTVGKPLGEPVEHQYLDLTAKRDEDFAQKSPIVLKETSTRSFAVTVTEVIFSDNSVWTPASGASWESLPAPDTLETALSDKELVKQYRLRYGETARYVYRREKDLWRCTCGAWNREDEPACHACRREAAVLAAADVEKLKAERDIRIAAEKKKAAAQKAIAEAQAKKAKKIAMIAVPAAFVAIVAIVLISGAVKKSNAYHDAAALLEAGEYDEAMEAFAVLGDYKDSAEMANQRAAYEKARFVVDCAERGDDAGLRVSSKTKPDPVETEDGGNEEAAGAEAPAEAAAGEEPKGPAGPDWEPPDTVTAKCCRKAIPILEELGEYQDSKALLEKAENLLQSEIDAKLEADYAEAVELLNEGESADACEAFQILGDYKDSPDKMNEAFLQNQLDDFSRSGSDALKYFGSHRTEYDRLNESELLRTMPGDWYVRDRYMNTYVYSRVKLNPNGTGSYSGSGTTAYHLFWRAVGNELYYESTTRDFDQTHADNDYNRYEFRKVADGLYIAYDHRGPTRYAFVDPASDWGKRMAKAMER